MNHRCLLKLLLVHVLGCAIIHNVRSQTSSAIPEIIQDCYKSNFIVTARPPLTMHLLIELIRKIEIDERNAINMRLLATSMIHGVLFNGVRRTRNGVPGDENIIPFRAVGEEFHNYRLLTDYLIPGQIALFPKDSLSLSELCFLHTIISSTVDPFERGDESLTCNDRSSMPLEVGDITTPSSCPLARGVIKTKWGPVAATHLISGIAAGLQVNSATFGRIINAIQTEGVESTPNTFITNNNEVNVVWVATMASDLARALLNQTSGVPLIGNGGFWNDTMLPRSYYLKLTTWDMTEADILAGIDGAILGSHVQGLLNVLESTRISQILDMYYSERGIPYQFGYKAHNRSTTFKSLVSTVNLEEQIIGSAKLLRTIGRYEFSLSEEAIKEFARTLSDHFKSVAEKLTNEYDGIEYLNGKQMKASLEVILILDNTFDYYKALQMIYSLSEAIQVSHYGSKLGIINGQSGNWMVNVTGEVFQIFTDLNEPQDEWPGFLSLSTSFETVMSYYQNRTFRDCEIEKIKPEGQVILVFSRDGRLTDNDVTRSRLSINTLKASYPGTRIIYATPREENSLQQLLVDNDSLIRISNDVVSSVQQVSGQLSEIPANIIKFYCNDTDVVFEDYVTPQLENIYEINKEYIKRGSVETKFINSNYGELVVCAYKSNTTNDRVCKGITVNGEISFNSRDFCTPDSLCDVHFAVMANSSQIRCAEYDCRFPDQVRMDIKYRYTATGSVVLSSLLLITITNLLSLIVNLTISSY